MLCLFIPSPQAESLGRLKADGWAAAVCLHRLMPLPQGAARGCWGAGWNNLFTDVACGRGKKADSTFCITCPQGCCASSVTEASGQVGGAERYLSSWLGLPGLRPGRAGAHGSAPQGRGLWAGGNPPGGGSLKPVLGRVPAHADECNCFLSALSSCLSFPCFPLSEHRQLHSKWC